MLKFKTVTDEKGCRELWEEFSPKQVLWDLWNFRYCFHAGNFSFNFILGLDGRNKQGILPLVFDSNENVYTYFGEDFPEQNKLLVKDKKNISLFLGQCPIGTSISYISSEETKFFMFEPDGKRYFLDLAKYANSFENYLKSFAKKHRKNLNYDLRKLKEKGYGLERNNLKDFDRLVELNRLKFGAESNYSSESFVAGTLKLMDSALGMGALDMISIRISGKVEAVGLGVFYNQVYYVLGSGRNVEIRNLGKLMVAEQIKSAIANKCSHVDFLSTEANWKELWNLDSEQLYEFRK